jgi:hypothetical protein
MHRVEYYSGKAGWVKNKPVRDFIALHYRSWLSKNPNYSSEVWDLIPLLLVDGWEPYTVTGENATWYRFRRKVNFQCIISSYGDISLPLFHKKGVCYS